MISKATYYYLSHVMVMGVGLAKTKGLTVLLDPNVFGQIQLVLPVLGWITILGGFGFQFYYVRFATSSSDSLLAKGYVATSAGIVLTSVVCFFLLLNFQVIPETIRIDFSFMVMLFAAALATQFFELIRVYYRVNEAHVAYNVIHVAGQLINLFFVFMMIFLLSDQAIFALLLGTTLGYSLLLVYFLIKEGSHLHWQGCKPSLEDMKKILSYSSPLLAVAISSDFFSTINRYVIVNYLDAVAVGKYVIGFLLASVCMNALHQPLFTFLHPLLFKAWEEEKKEHVETLLNRYFELYLVVGLLLGGLVIRGEDLLINLISSPDYGLPPYTFFILVFVWYIMGIYRFVATHYYLRKNTLELMVVFCLSVLVNTSLAIVLIQFYGLLGVSIASVISAGFLSGVIWWRGRCFLKIVIRFQRLFIPALLFLALVSIPIPDSWQLNSFVRWGDALFSFVIVALTLGLIFFRKECLFIFSKIR
ncbi:MAG: lipopolysaccharide biosynthesis protein [Magnetococcus sp. DMHC-6]